MARNDIEVIVRREHNVVAEVGHCRAGVPPAAELQQLVKRLCNNTCNPPNTTPPGQWLWWWTRALATVGVE